MLVHQIRDKKKQGSCGRAKAILINKKLANNNFSKFPDPKRNFSASNVLARTGYFCAVLENDRLADVSALAQNRCILAPLMGGRRYLCAELVRSGQSVRIRGQ